MIGGRKVGVELTFIPKVCQINDERPSDWNLVPKADEAREILNARKIKTWNCNTDPDCVEIPTRPRANKKTLMKDIAAIRGVAEEIGLIKGHDWWTTGGGAHIHVSTKDDDIDLAVLFFMLKYWSAPWAFAHYANSRCGIHNPLGSADRSDELLRYGDSIASSTGLRDKINEIEANRNAKESDALARYCRLNPDYDGWCAPYHIRERLGKQQKAAVNKAVREVRERCSVYDLLSSERTSYGDSWAFITRRVHGVLAVSTTTEFRFFKATESLQEDMDHIDFVEAVYAYAAKNTLQLHEWARSITIADYVRDRENTTHSSKSRINSNFRSCLRVLGLDAGRYAPYTKNLNLRIAFSKQEGGKQAKSCGFGYDRILC